MLHISGKTIVLQSAVAAGLVSVACACPIHRIQPIGPMVADEPMGFNAAPARPAAGGDAAVLVPNGLNVPGIRPMMAGEGLLESKANPFAVGGARFGHEFSGWIDVRHPSLAGPGSTLLGYDRYDRQISQATTILTDRNGVVAGADVTRDLNHANRVFASQAGVSMIERSTRGYTSPAVGTPGSFNFPLSHGLGAAQAGQPQEEQAIMGQNVGGNRMNVYYGRDLTSGAYGETYNPSFTAGGNNEAIFMAERVASGPGFIPITRNTHAHEATHFVTDGLALHNQNAAPDQAHSGDRRNIIGNPQFDPGQAAGALGGGMPAWAIPDNDSVAGPSMSQGAGGAPKVGGISQLKRSQVFTANSGVFGDADVAPYLSKAVNDQAGNRVDWNFLVDDWITEDLGGSADQYIGGRESLYFTAGNPVAAADPAATADNGGKDKTGLGAFNNPPAYQGSFLFADIFSLNARYGDYDVNDAGDESFRACNLDYDVTFVLENNTLVPGTPVAVYTEGWNLGVFGEDWLTRWMSPSAAIGVLVTAHQYRDLVTNEVIGQTQIDAVIASNVPEPSCLGALGFALAASRWRRK